MTGTGTAVKTLSDDERMLLAVLAAAPEPIGLQEVMQELLSPRPDGPGWYGRQWWGRQWCATAKNWIDLRTAGLFEPTPSPAGSRRSRGGYSLTEAGQQALAAARGDFGE